jgi:hypothetical protein
MPDNKSQVIETLGDCLEAMAVYAGGSVPASNEIEYDQWLGWIQRGQEDAAKRGFWGRLLVPADLAIVAGEQTAILPDNFHKRNGIYVLTVDGTDWASKNNDADQVLTVYKDFATGAWVVRFKEVPTADATGKLWYFYNPPIPTDLEDVLYLDGEMIMFYALKEFYRKSQQPGSLDDARIEYENRFEEGLTNEVLPTVQELAQWQSYHSFLGQREDERIRYYRGRSGRTRR